MFYLILNCILCYKIKTTRSIYVKVLDISIELALLSHILNLVFLFVKE